MRGGGLSPTASANERVPENSLCKPFAEFSIFDHATPLPHRWNPVIRRRIALIDPAMLLNDPAVLMIDPAIALFDRPIAVARCPIAVSNRAAPLDRCPARCLTAAGAADTSLPRPIPTAGRG
jgi:hypothetical protein